jgi:hypothetical protein
MEGATLSACYQGSDTGHQKILVRGRAFLAGGHFGSGSMFGWSLKVAVRRGLGSEVLPRRFRCSGLAALPSGSACHRMTSGSVVTG